jgi:hypothetical protein
MHHQLNTSAHLNILGNHLVISFDQQIPYPVVNTDFSRYTKLVTRQPHQQSCSDFGWSCMRRFDEFHAKRWDVDFFDPCTFMYLLRTEVLHRLLKVLYDFEYTTLEVISRSKMGI